MSTWLRYNCSAGSLPVPAAVVILYEEQGGRLLFAKRNEQLSFMGGHYAFPGGHVAEADTGRCVHPSHDPEDARFLTAAVREVFEETGLLLTTPELRSYEMSDPIRRAVMDDPPQFESFLEAEGLSIDRSAFVSAGRWITPSFSPRRFDTRYFFFQCAEPLPGTPMGDDEEITALRWLTPREALEQRGMKRMTLSTPLIFVLQRLAAFPLEEALERLQHTPGFSDTLMDYIEPASGIHIVPVRAPTLPPSTHTNCVIVGEKELAIVDPGIADEKEQERFSRHVQTLCEGLKGKPAAVVLTHDHPDHCAFAAQLSEQHHIPIYGHPSVTQQFLNTKSLSDGEVLTLEGSPPWRLRCIYTPGHHPGHCCYFEERSCTLLAGDLVANPGTILIDPDHGGDMDAYIKSLDLISRIEALLTIPAHGPPLIKDEGAALFRNTLEHRLMRENKIKELLETGVKDIKQLLPLAYDDVPVELHDIASGQLRAHLQRINKQQVIPT